MVGPVGVGLALGTAGRGWNPRRGLPELGTRYGRDLLTRLSWRRAGRE